MTTTQVREILVDDDTLTSILLKYDPSNKLLIYYDDGTNIYKTITSWCDINKNLKQNSDGVLSTYTGIIYEPNKKAFVYIDRDKGYISVEIDKIISTFIPGIQFRCNFDQAIFFIDEKYFSPTIIEMLENLGYISKPIELPISLFQ